MKKQIYSVLAISCVLLLMSSIFNSCIQDETFAKATVETNQVTSVTEATATCGGIISTDGGSDVTARGVCWSTSPNPKIENDTTLNAAGTGTFNSLLKGLSPITTYYVRAYAINKGGTSYGLQMIFTTKTYSITTTPISVSSLTATSAISGGNIISDGDSSTLTVKARGVCWNTFPTPTIENNKTTDGISGGRFTSSITGLTANTLYYVRAYAINSVGMTYGNEVSFTTQSSETDIDGNVYSIVKIGTQVWMAENLKTTKYNDGTSIPNVTDATAWINLTTPGYCFHNNDAANKNIYGALYNWYTVNTGKLAPKGWHVPSDAEWATLENYLIANGYNYDGTTTGYKIAKSLAATTGWNTSTTLGAIGNDLTKNNSSGFTALPGGYRDDNFRGEFGDVGGSGLWWSSTQYGTTDTWCWFLNNSSCGLSSYPHSNKRGLSVRCVKD